MTAFVPSISETDLKKIILSLQQLAAGRSNAVGTITLTQSASSTTVSVANGALTQSGTIAPGSQPIFTPATAAAAAELASGNMYVSAVAKDSFTITHTNSATAGRTFYWAILG